MNKPKMFWILGRPIHPVKAIVALCATTLFSLPFIAQYILLRQNPFYLYLIYPLLFLISHLVCFRLPFVLKTIRWLMFWFSLSVVAALGSGFLFMGYWEASLISKQLEPKGFFLIPTWLNPHLDASFSQVALYFLLPSALGAGIYTVILLFILRIDQNRRSSTAKDVH